jgi:hypothetical protein
MAWMKNIATGYHQQDTDYYCGAAVAQMILDEIGAGLIDLFHFLAIALFKTGF